MSDEQIEREVGDLDDEYTILGELGRGGSAIVYRARDRVLYRDVAIKVVRPRFAATTDEALARLAREARTVARLQHPNIVTVHAVKQLRDGGLALVMQLVPGRTLKQAVIDDGAFAPDRAERVIRDVADALAYAHAHGVVHRDVKPENIFIEAETGRALLSDFGIAHSTEFDSRLTMDGAAIGTPAYMAPEQIDGAPANARSDLYSLGLVAWEMLTGERPWEGEALYNVIFKQKNEDLPAIDELRPGMVPPRLQYIVERMMQKKPSARWAGADGLLTALNSWVVPTDWRQWEDSHRRRRDALKAKARSKTPTKDLTSQATLRFTRPAEGIAPAVGLPANGAMITPKHGSASVGGANGLADGAPVVMLKADDPPDDAPSWATESSDHSRSRRWAMLGGLLLVVGGGTVATFSQRARLFPRHNEPTTIQSDSRSVELPIVSPVVTDSARNTAAAIPDSGAGGATNAATLAAENARRDAIRDSMRADALRVDSLNADFVARFKYARGRGNDSTRAESMAAAQMRRALRRTGRSGITLPTSLASAMSSGSAAPGAAQTPFAKPFTPVATKSAPLSTTGAAAGTLAAPMLASPSAVAAAAAASVAAKSASVDAPRAESVRSSDDPGVIAAGGRHSCALVGGKVYCWGANDKGQLGDGDVESRESPAPIVGDLSFAQVATGLSHSCGIARGGDAYCWGADETGQLGDATTTSRSAPVRVTGNLSFRAIRLGLAHSCGLTTGGDVACWGSNTNGQVGDGSTASRSSPVVLNTGVRYISLSAGGRHSCAVASDGSAWCWGSNSSGQLGNGTRTESRAPVAVSGDLRFTSISAGSTHSCGVTDSGDAYCWGKNSYGQLGNGNTTDQVAPTKVEGGTRFASVSVGSVHSCARTRSGQAWCWGRNVYGQLGDGSFSLRDTPTRVIGGAVFAAVNATGAHTCGTSTDGETYCWGFNVDGQLGDGTRNHSARPTKVTVAGR